ncbi:MAG TPA: cupredoxin family copper-binding protein [Candidatus Baltobacteraceae bacterium]|nr:cupredoxin family copper-binding protein [Candidatus Baltobacteraceae bacterium]
MRQCAFVLALLFTAATAGAGTAAAQQAGNAANALTVHIKDMAFKPDSATVPAGSTVTFVNDDQVAHTVTASDQSFDSKDIAPGKSWQMTFTKAGTYPYVCIYHPGLAGKITVGPAQ